MSTNYPYITRQSDVAINIDGIPHTIAKSDPRYQRVIEAIKDKVNRDSDIRMIVDRHAAVEAAITASGDSRFTMTRTTVAYKGEQVAPAMAARIIDMAKEGYDLNPLANFQEELSHNPSNRVHTSLFKFLEVGKMAITPDGHFLAYKKVAKKYPNSAKELDKRMAERGYDFNLVDVHTKKISNAVGAVVEMPRHLVNDDPDVTCSHGLHVCSHEYLQHFSGDAVVVCKVSPRDVVAIPRDYNDSKMRVCKYEVIGILGEEQVNSKVLSSASVIEEEDFASKPTRWAVEVKMKNGRVKVIDCASRSEARAVKFTESQKTGQTVTLIDREA